MMSTVKVFKFGGASVKDSASIRNVKSILQEYNNSKVIVVISAMGKTTNLLEEIFASYLNHTKDLEKIWNRFYDFHNSIISELELNDPIFTNDIEITYNKIQDKLSQKPSNNKAFEYDQIVSFGEILSTKIVAAYLKKENLKAFWVDAREVVKTDKTYQEGRVNWELTQQAFDKVVQPNFSKFDYFISQGFIGQTEEGTTTTLGREGSDFTASIFAYISKADSVTIWKDVPGMLNADPKYFSGTVLLKTISFTEAVELAYYGASVIHPKTIQPLKNRDIPLYIKSFLNPSSAGTVIQSSTKYDAVVPSYIFKDNQILISLTPKDFSFVVEDQLTDIFALLTKQKIRINLMQNSAVSFSLLIDDKYNLDQLITNLSNDFNVTHIKELQLLTIRHFNDETIERLTANKSIILTQKTAETARIILK
ncbi:MAG: aspartate kinase [Crocinitomicaceae bacterium]